MNTSKIDRLETASHEDLRLATSVEMPRILLVVDESHATLPQVRAMFAGDFSRKTTLVAALLTMGLSTVAIGLVPTYHTIGVAAPVALA